MKEPELMPYLPRELRSFLISEVSSLREEMKEAVKETRVLERWALTAGAGIWTWLATHPERVESWFPWLPAVLVFIFYFRTLALMKHIDGIAGYVHKVETRYPLPDPFGFEGYYASSCGRMIKRATGHIFWVLLLVLTVLAPFFAPPNRALERSGSEAKIEGRSLGGAGRSAPDR